MNNKRSKISVVASIIIAMLIASIDTTIVNTTMPVIVEELGGFRLYAWGFTSYIIASTALMPISGRISDMFGRKRVFGLGIILFLIGSLLCGLSGSMLQLVIYRAIQGIGAGVMMPLIMIITGDLFSISQRGKIQGVFSTMWSLSALIAPMIGAFFVEFTSWRWIFYINVPICIIALLLLVPYKEEYVPKRAAVNYWGAILFTVGVSTLLLLTVVSKYFIIYAVIGLGLLALFFLHERKHASPIVPMGMFKNKTVGWMIVNGFLITAALFGSSSYIPLILQKSGHSIFISGIVLLGMSIGWTAASIWTGNWILRFGYRPLIIIGNALLVVSASLSLYIGEGTGFWYIFAIMIVQGLSFGLIFTVSVIGAQQLVGPNEKGISTSLQMFFRNIGLAIGVTMMGLFLTRAEEFYSGIHNLFLYGFIVSLLAFASSLLIVDSKQERAEGPEPLESARASLENAVRE
jgi:EmrB/QacA subfamily drug resistance transporter